MSTPQIVATCIGSFLVYLFMMGLASTLSRHWLTEWKKDEREVFSVFWPVMFVCWILYFAVVLGTKSPQMIATLFSRKSKLPKAIVHAEE